MNEYPIYNHNWRDISTIYIYITRLASNEIFSPSNKIHREVGWAKDLSAPPYKVLFKKLNGILSVDLSIILNWALEMQGEDMKLRKVALERIK